MIDLHIHTIHSDGTASVSEVLAESERLGLKAISITDHNTVDAYKEIEDNDLRKSFSGKIIIGVELAAIVGGIEIEVLGYNIDWRKMDELIPIGMNGDTYHKGLPLDEIIGMIHKCDGKAILAHPGRYKNAIDAVIDKIDGIEVYHFLNDNEYREKLLAICKERGLIITGGSDYHGTAEPQLINSENLPIKLLDQF